MKSWKLSWKEEVYDEKKSYSLKIRVSKVLLCFKDKAFDVSTSFMTIKSYQISILYETLSFMTMKVIIFYEKKFMKKSFIIL